MRYLLLLLSLSAFGQYSHNGDFTFLGGKLDASAVTRLAPPSKASDPATCTPGDFYWNTTSSLFRQCDSVNHWSDWAGTGGATSIAGRYSASLNFASIPDFGCADLTMTATGITAGAALSVALPSAIETGLTGIALVSAADTVKVRLCNQSGASVDPANGTFSVRDMDTLGYLSGSGTINFGSIPDGGCLASTLTVTGAAAADNVAEGWPAALETGLSGKMFVSATDTVAVRLCNSSGAAVDPASATFKAAITK